MDGIGFTDERVTDLKVALLLEREPSVTFAEMCRADELVTDEELVAKYGNGLAGMLGTEPYSKEIR